MMFTTAASSTTTTHIHEYENDDGGSDDPIHGIGKLQICLNDLDKIVAEMRKNLEALVHARYKQANTRTLSLFRQARTIFHRSQLHSRGRSTRRGEIVDAEFLQTKHRLTKVISQRHETAKKLTRLQASMSPCRRVPPELWSLIFQFCLLEDGHYTKPDINKAPLLMCGVCRSWRELAIGLPSLWNSLSISRNWRRRPNSAQLQEWLRRSGKLPLSIEVSFASSPKPGACQDWEVLQLLLSCSDRWHRLHLDAGLECLYQTILSIRMPILHTLELSNKRAIRSLSICPTDVPNLRTVSFLTASLDPSHLTLPWQRLSRVSSCYWTDVHSHLQVMSRCPKLEHMRAHVLHAHCAQQPIETPLLMPNLNSLEVVALNGGAMSLLLERLVVPSLEELTLVVPEESPEYGVSGWPKASVVCLSERSRCRAVRVHLHGIDILSTDE